MKKKFKIANTMDIALDLFNEAISKSESCGQIIEIRQMLDTEEAGIILSGDFAKLAGTTQESKPYSLDIGNAPVFLHSHMLKKKEKAQL